jgi:DNA-binding transcriptional ArsR family regulator
MADGECIEFDAILLPTFNWPDRWKGSPSTTDDINRKAAMTAEQRRLVAALERAERSASWLGRQAGVSPMTVSRWLGRAKGDHGTRVPEDKRKAVAAALGCTVRDLFTERKAA